MKVSDLDLITSDGALLDRMVAATKTQEFERKVLEHCRGNNMDRVVVALDFGDQMETYEGAREPLFYLVFELAKCDARVQVNLLRRFDFTWSLHTLHNLAVAVSQLHRAEVSHNDIKPSNILVFDDLLQKLGDLGRATSPLIPAIHDEELCSGDPRYAPPESLYSPAISPSAALRFDQRRASDLYLLGSMGCFFATGVMMTPAVFRHLAPVHRPPCGGGGWNGDFAGALPYWREALSAALMDLRAALPVGKNGVPPASADSFLEAVTQLCEPDPLLRGHPLNRRGHQDRYGVERYVSVFNRLRRSVMH